MLHAHIKYNHIRMKFGDKFFNKKGPLTFTASCDAFASFMC